MPGVHPLVVARHPAGCQAELLADDPLVLVADQPGDVEADDVEHLGHHRPVDVGVDGVDVQRRNVVDLR